MKYSDWPLWKIALQKFWVVAEKLLFFVVVRFFATLWHLRTTSHLRRKPVELLRGCIVHISKQIVRPVVRLSQCAPPLQRVTWTATQRWPGDLYLCFIFDLLTLEMVQNVRRGGATFLPVLVFVRLFVVELWANMYQTDDMKLLPWPLTFDVTAQSVMRAIVLHPCTKFEVRLSATSEAFSVSALIGLETLTFDLSISKWGHGSVVSWVSFLLIFSFLCPSILDLGSGMGQTDRKMDKQTTAINS